MIFFLVDPQKIVLCFSYARNYLSITQCIIASLITSCAFISVATMNQIRVNIKVILKDIETKESAEKRIRNFNYALTTFWCVNQVGSVVLTWWKDDLEESLYLQITVVLLILSIFGYVLTSLIKALRRLE